jgi:hypothetical protein
MSPHEKAPYERMFEEYKRKNKQIKCKHIFDLLNLAQIKRLFIFLCYLLAQPVIPTGLKTDESTMIHNRQESIIKQLSYFFKDRTTSLKLSNEKQQEFIQQQPWYLIKFQTFCKSEANPYASELDYSPYYYVLAEVALVEFSIEQGIINTYHAFIKPNQVPLGYRSQCMESERDIHQIPLDNFNRITSTYAEIYSNIASFVRLRQENSHYAPLFCLGKDIDQTRFGLKFLQDMSAHRRMAGSEDLHELVFDLECLYMYLADVRDQTVTYSSANENLTSYTYDYSPNTACDFHEDKAGMVNCALGTCKRYCYLMADVLCGLYEVELTDNHLPIEREAGVRVTHQGQDGFRCSARHQSGYESSKAASISSSTHSQKRMYANQDDDFSDATM